MEVTTKATLLMFELAVSPDDAVVQNWKRQLHAHLMHL